MRWTWAAAICQGAKPQLSRIGGRASVLSEPAPPTPVCPALLARVALGMGRSRPGTKGMRLSAQGERIKYSRPGGTQSRATYILRQNLGCGQRPCSAGERRRSSPTDGRPSKILKPRGSCGVTLRSPTRCEKSLHVPTPRGGTESSNLLCSSGESPANLTSSGGDNEHGDPTPNELCAELHNPSLSCIVPLADRNYRVAPPIERHLRAPAHAASKGTIQGAASDVHTAPSPMATPAMAPDSSLSVAAWAVP